MINTIKKIQQQISNNSVLLYMKGTPKLPECGFSARAVKIILNCIDHFTYINILTNLDIRVALPQFANWPTFPQLWVNGELIGGCDIITEMYNNGELQLLLKEALIKHNLYTNK